MIEHAILNGYRSVDQYVEDTVRSYMLAGPSQILAV
jgi:hypothetical protein